VTLAMVRGGRHLGDRSFFPQNAAGSDACTVVEAFLTQHYARSSCPGAWSATRSRTAGDGGAARELAGAR
jgi:excinuclease UvrABC nuclease subunit